MTATIKEADQNQRRLTIQFISYGHWLISCNYRNKRISTRTTASHYIDDFNSDLGEKDCDGFNRRKRGYEALCTEIINNIRA